MNSYYESRAFDLITDDIDVEYANASTRFNKEWFIQRMRGAFSILSTPHMVNGIQKPVSAAYYQQFQGNKIPHPEMNSWMMLFARYQFFQKQATNYMHGLRTPHINDLMAEITNNSAFNNKFNKWYEMTLDYLHDFGSLYIMEIDRNPKDSSGIVFNTTRAGSVFKLGYREVFSIPKFGEIYCETNDKDSIHLADQLISVEMPGLFPTRYYSIMMCEKLPAQIFANQKQR